MSEKSTKVDRVAFGSRLRAAREDRGWTQKQLAAACGVSDGMVVSKWENGVNVPGDRVPWLLCQIFGVDTWIRLWGDEPISPVVVRAGDDVVLSGEGEERVKQAASILRALADELD